MKPNPLHRLPAPLEAAVQRLKLAARQATESAVEGLGLGALASTSAVHRDGLLSAQFEFNRKQAVFLLTFNEAFDQGVLRELGAPPGEGAADQPPPAASNWDELRLVDDEAVEAQISAERFSQAISQTCEWELRELEGYVSSLLIDAGGQRDRNPLRPDLVGGALLRGIEAVSDRPDVRTLLSAELSRSLGGLLRGTYAEIVAGLRGAGVQPLALTVRHRQGGPGRDGGHSRHGASTLDAADPASGHSAAGDFDSLDTGRRGAPSGFMQAPGAAPHGGAASLLGQVDPALMSIIRRLAYAGGGDQAGEGRTEAGHGELAAGEQDEPAPHNLIHAHREELRQASRGAIDHRVIDVIGLLFDQILADPKVPPQMARQIARLQLPVLRAALGDPSFFSSRRHPVRRFVNRIASLGAAVEDFGDERGQALLAKVSALVQEVVQGDFEQIATYEQKLAALEAFTTELAARDIAGGDDAAALLSEKEDQQRLRQLYAQRLDAELKDVAAPPFLREFVSRVWSQVLLRAVECEGADGALAQRLRRAGGELFLSVQPKATPAQRKVFLAELPKLMQTLTEGMDLVVWPQEQRRDFFAQLMPAHAQALRSRAGSPLDFNLVARQVAGVLQRPLPSLREAGAAQTLPVLTDELPAAQFSAEEARRVGLVQESAVDWAGAVEPEAAALAEPAIDDTVELPGLPTSAGPPEPAEGRALAEYVEVGFAYRMNLDGAWHKVRLSHVSPGRGFFIFTRGSRHKMTISLTRRMLVKLCEAGRLKAFESAFLVDRASARARRQLATMGGGQVAGA